jgi:hypothetical protein
MKWLKISREDHWYVSIGFKGDKIKGLKVGCKMQQSLNPFRTCGRSQLELSDRVSQFLYGVYG